MLPRRIFNILLSFLSLNYTNKRFLIFFILFLCLLFKKIKELLNSSEKIKLRILIFYLKPPLNCINTTQNRFLYILTLKGIYSVFHATEYIIKKLKAQHYV